MPHYIAQSLSMSLVMPIAQPPTATEWQVLEGKRKAQIL